MLSRKVKMLNYTLFDAYTCQQHAHFLLDSNAKNMVSYLIRKDHRPNWYLAGVARATNPNRCSSMRHLLINDKFRTSCTNSAVANSNRHQFIVSATFGLANLFKLFGRKCVCYLRFLHVLLRMWNVIVIKYINSLFFVRLCVGWWVCVDRLMLALFVRSTSSCVVSLCVCLCLW